MRRTLFYLPHEIWGIQVFGWGWVLAIWLAFSAVVLILAIRRQGWNRDASSQILMMLCVAAAIVGLIPRIEEPILGPAWVFPPVSADSGLPIRGYGVLMLLGVIAGVALASARAAKAGLSPDAIMGLATFMVIGGILGARLFFVIQYWPTLRADSLRETIGNLLSIDKGGLVVYGSLIGAMVAFGIFSVRHRLPPLALADLIAPSMALGLAIGRLGCLLNGCCFGGVCEPAPWSLQFPGDSPPYLHQQAMGEFWGLQLGHDDQRRVLVQTVTAGSTFRSELAGQRIVGINGRSVRDLEEAQWHLSRTPLTLTLQTENGQQHRGHLEAWPARSLPVHPTQIYSSVNALLLCALVLALYPFRNRHGQVIATLLTLYAGTRFLWSKFERTRAKSSQISPSRKMSASVSDSRWSRCGSIFSDSLHLGSRATHNIQSLGTPAGPRASMESPSLG